MSQQDGAIRSAREHYDAGRMAEAEAACRLALQIEPNDIEALYVLGMIAGRGGHVRDAVALLSRAAQLRPDRGDVHAGLGLALMNVGRLAEAQQALQAAVRLIPDHFGAWHNLGVICERGRRLRDAAQCFRRATSLLPNHALAHLNLGTMLRDLGKMDEALAELRRAIELEPNLAHAHMMLAWVLLLTGDFEKGLPEYEWRWRCPGFQRPALQQPLWDGSALNGRTILLHAEQGLGDTIQFIRYASMLAESGARVVALAPGSLVPLLSSAPGVCAAAARLAELGSFDVWCPMCSLPLRFATKLSSIPAPVPYLHAEPRRVDIWKQRLQGDGGGLKVGLCWAGNRAHPNDLNRSIALPMLARLAQIPGVRFYSLQLGQAADQARVNPAMNLIDHTRFIQDFADTAALIMHLDLIISVDTSAAHLAGALGRRVWVLLPFAPDWRWLLDRPDSPWYPTMRLFRQRPEEAWDRVIGEVAAQMMQLDPNPR